MAEPVETRAAATLSEWFDGFVGSEEERQKADAVLAAIEAASELTDHPFGQLNERSFYRLREALDALD